LGKIKAEAALFAALALVGAIGLYMATALGMGSSFDSFVYVYAARSVLQGQGLLMQSPTGALVPMTHYPPLYPLALAAISALGVDPLVAARGLNLVLFAMNGWLIAATIYVFTRRSLLTAALGEVVALSSVDLLFIHSWAWSEPLFILLGLVGLILLAAYLSKPRGWMLIVSAAALSAAFLTRYTGFALVLSALAALMLLGPGLWRAWLLALSGKGWWRKAGSPQANEAMSTAWFREQGLVSLTERYAALHQ